MDVTVNLPKKEILRSKTDAAWKTILNQYLKQFLELCWTEAYQEIDWNKPYEFLEQEMMLIGSSQKENSGIVDKLIKVYLKGGREQWILIHIEIQGNCEKFFVKRMYIYNYRIFDRYQRSVASMAVLVDSNKNWRPNIYQNEVFGWSVKMKFPVLKILDFKAKEHELLASNNPFAFILVAQLKAIESKGNETKKLANKKDIAKMLYKKSYEKSAIINIGRFLDGIFAMSKSNVLEYNKFVKEIEKELNVSYLTTFEEIGLERGLELGRKEGYQEGQKTGERTLLCHQLNLKFQALSTQYQDKINSADPNKLMIWAERILYCNTIEQIFED